MFYMFVDIFNTIKQFFIKTKYTHAVLTEIGKKSVLSRFNSKEVISATQKPIKIISEHKNVPCGFLIELDGIPQRVHVSAADFEVIHKP